MNDCEEVLCGEYWSFEHLFLFFVCKGCVPITLCSDTKFYEFISYIFRVLPKEKIVQNARKRIGEIGYSLLHDNCEHFAVWCRYGTKKSKQADDAIFWYVLSGIVIWVAVLVTLTVSTVDDADKNI